MSELRTAKLAEKIGVHEQRIYQWAREGLADAAKLRRGYWDEAKALQWVEARRMANVREPTNLPEPTYSAADIVEARTRLYTLQGDGAELRNAILRGELITRALLESVLAELGSRLLQPLDEWVRAGGSAAQIARNKEAADALRSTLEGAVEDLRSTLDAGEDLSATRVRLPRRMGG